MQEPNDESDIISTSPQKANAVIKLAILLNNLVLSNSDAVSNIDVAGTKALEVVDLTRSRQFFDCIQKIMLDEDEDSNTISSR